MPKLDRHTLPVSVSDALFHHKDTDRTERIVMPITRYGNILNAPKVVKTGNQVVGAPFALMQTGTETVTAEEIRRLCGPIL